MRRLQVRNRSDCRNPPLKTAPATRWEADVHNRAKTRFPRQRAKAEQIKNQSHEKGGPALSQVSFFAPLGRKPRISQVRRPKSNQSNDARSTTQQNPIDLAAQSRCAGKSNRLRNTFISAAKPNRSHRTIDNATRPNQTHRAANAALRPNSTRGTAGTQPTRRRRPHGPRGAAGHTARTVASATRPETACASSYR